MAELEPAQSLDSLTFFCPLPYRLALVTVLGVWLWGANLHGLSRVNIDTPALIRYPARSDPPPYISVYRFATALSTSIAASMLLYLVITFGKQDRAAYDILPNVTLIFVLLAFAIPHRFVYPKNMWPGSGRSRLISTIRRISIGGLARTEDGKFGDVLLADALTSYARPLSELYIAFYMFFSGQSTTGSIDRASTYFVGAAILAVPFAIRLRQCLNDGQRANALKYATAFPAIGLSMLMRTENGYLNHTTVSSLWQLAALTNALYSFYWDVARDWDLTLLSPKRSSSDYPYGLRPVRYLGEPQVYYAMIAIDLLLRFAWALKLSPHLEHFYDIEGGIFLLELSEIFRRFLWVFFRVETEWIRTRHSSDVVLGDLGPKIDED